MKILDKIKKHFNKILIACLTLISSIAIFSSINKTYAYQSDKFTYTTTLYTDNTYTNELELTTNNNIENSLLLNNNSSFYFNINNMNNNFDFSGYYFLVNFYFFNSSNQIASATNNIIFRLTFGQNNNTGDLTYVPRQIRQFDNCYTAIMQFNSQYNYYYNNHCKIQFITSSQVSNGYIVIKNFDVVKPSDIGLEQYYDTYYGQIEDNYNQLQSDYNDLQDNYQDLENNYNTLEDNYNDLQEQYQTTEQENLENQLYNQYGDLYNSSLYITYYLNGVQNNYSLSFEEMINNNIISNSYLYYDRALQYFNIDTSSSGGVARTQLVFARPINVSNFNWTFRNDNISGISFDMEFNDTNLETFDVGFASEAASPIILNTEFLLTKQVGSNIDINNLTFNDFRLSFNYEVIEPVWISINTNYASNYNDGYNNGYRQAYNEQTKEYQSIISNLRNQIDTLTTQSENAYNTGYQIGLNEGASQNLETNGVKTLFNSILSYPVNMIKSIFNFEFMGVNVSGIITFVISMGIILFVVKKWLGK